MHEGATHHHFRLLVLLRLLCLRVRYSTHKKHYHHGFTTRVTSTPIEGSPVIRFLHSFLQQLWDDAFEDVRAMLSVDIRDV